MGFNGTFYDLINNIFIGFFSGAYVISHTPIEPEETICILLYILGLIYCKLCKRSLGQTLKELSLMK